MDSEITFFNATGQVSLSANHLDSHFNKPIDVSSLDNGLYIVRVKNDGFISTRTIEICR